MRSAVASAVVFVASGSVLVLEIMAGRLLAPYVGVTLQTFTAIIGVVLAGIAAGTWSGGWLADRFDPLRLLPGALILGGALAVASVPVIRLFGSGQPGGSDGTVVALATLGFFAPAAVLSSVTPIVVKVQLADLSTTGHVVGRLSAIGTAGSLVGVFVTGFVLIAAFPTTPVIVTLGAALVAIGVGLWLYLGRHLRGDVVIAGVALLAASTGLAAAASGPCETETAYFCARVERDETRPAGRSLWLDTLRHSYVDLDDPTHLEFRYTRILGRVVDVLAPAGQPLETVHLGGGGFTMPRYVQGTRPGSSDLVLELDPGLVDLAQDQLGLVLTDRLRVSTGDGRVTMAALGDATADLVIGDAFGGVAVPWHLTTRQFLDDVRRVLRPDGIYAMNLIDRPPLGFARAEVATLRDVFEHVAVVAPAAFLEGTAGGNFVILASDAGLPLTDLEAILSPASDGTVTTDAAVVDRFVGGADVLTDEHAPVDQLLTG